MSVTVGMPTNRNRPEHEARRVVRRISRPRIWQYDYLMLREIAAGLKRQVASLNGKTSLEILDVGCKYTPYRELFAARASRYVGMDLSPYHGVSVRGDALALPFQSDSFDLILCTQAFYLMADFRNVLAEFTRVTRAGGRIIVTTIGIWPHPPSDRLHRWSRRELEDVLSEYGEVRVEETGGYLQLVPQLANAVLALGVEGHMVKRHPSLGRVLALPLKGIYLGVNALGLASDRLIRAASASGWGLAQSLCEVDTQLAINYLAVVTPKK
jgi:SAM-dependent methyltransferase